MVEGLVEIAFEAVGWAFEFAFDLFVTDHKHDNHDAIRRYADSLYEEQPLPPAIPQDMNQ